MLLEKCNKIYQWITLKSFLISLPVERFNTLLLIIYRTNIKLELITKLKCEVVNIAGDLIYLIQ